MQPLEDELRMVDGEEMTAQMRKLDAQVVEALERKPRVVIPQGFAARAALQASALRAHVAVRAPRFGLTAVVICAVLSAAAMLLLAPRTAGHDAFWMALQWVLCGQFCALTAWLGLSRQETE
jgi:hypothetical protein